MLNRIPRLVLLPAALLVVAGCPGETPEPTLDEWACDLIGSDDTSAVTAGLEPYFDDDLFVAKQTDSARVNVVTGRSADDPTFVGVALDEQASVRLYADAAEALVGWWVEHDEDTLPAGTPHEGCPDAIGEQWTLGPFEPMVEYHLQLAASDAAELRLLVLREDG
jgi:hypothetical protein